MKIGYKKLSIGSHIIVGLMLKTSIEKVNNNLKAWFFFNISHKIIIEKIMDGRSGLGDCKNKNNIG